MSITHAKVSAIADDPAAQAAGEVLPSDWNDDHVISLQDADIPATIARDAEVTSAISTHNSDTTAVHGIADTSLVKGVYVQAGDPGAVGAGFFWLDTSGNLRVRNSADAAWIEVVSVD